MLWLSVKSKNQFIASYLALWQPVVREGHASLMPAGTELVQTATRTPALSLWVADHDWMEVLYENAACTASESVLLASMGWSTAVGRRSRRPRPTELQLALKIHVEAYLDFDSVISESHSRVL